MASEVFLSTPSARRATQAKTDAQTAAQISIHALREEGDCLPSADVDRMQEFLSTPSARRATICYSPPRAFLIFLSTPSARRATVRLSWSSYSHWYFYPRPPRGGRLGFCLIAHRPIRISIHALREEGDSG